MNLTFKIFNPLDYFWKTFSLDLGVDLGTSNTKIAVCGKGTVVREPTVVASHKKTKQIIAIGTEARKMLGKTPASIVAARPLANGVINDLELAEALLKHFIKKIHQSPSSFPKIPRPKVVLAVPSGATEVERRALSDAAVNAGAREAYLLEEPMAAALGARLAIDEPNGNMIVDIGGGTTEIAIISLGGIVVCKSLRIAGMEMDEEIISYVRSRYNLLLGIKTAEEIKIAHGSAYPAIKESKVQVYGRDLATGLPTSVQVSTGEIREALSNTLHEIVEGIKETIEDSPPELVNDVAKNGIYLSGGSSLLKGLPQFIAKETKIPVVLVEDPLTTVVKGTSRVLENKNIFKKLVTAGALK